VATGDRTPQQPARGGAERRRGGGGSCATERTQAQTERPAACGDLRFWVDPGAVDAGSGSSCEPELLVRPATRPGRRRRGTRWTEQPATRCAAAAVWTWGFGYTAAAAAAHGSRCDGHRLRITAQRISELVGSFPLGQALGGPRSWETLASQVEQKAPRDVYS
jgi:hypothetical protein